MPAVAALIDAFRQGLRELGYVEGQNIRLEIRWADGNRDRLPQLAGELVSLKVDRYRKRREYRDRRGEKSQQHNPYRHDAGCRS